MVFTHLFLLVLPGAPWQQFPDLDLAAKPSNLSGSSGCSSVIHCSDTAALFCSLGEEAKEHCCTFPTIYGDPGFNLCICAPVFWWMYAPVLWHCYWGYTLKFPPQLEGENVPSVSREFLESYNPKEPADMVFTKSQNYLGWMGLKCWSISSLVRHILTWRGCSV